MEKRFPQILHLKGRSPVCERRWICRALSLPNTLAQNLHLCLKNGSSELGLVSNTDTFGGLPFRCFMRAERGSSALAVAAMLASGFGKMTLLEELEGIRGRLEGELKRLPWVSVGGLEVLRLRELLTLLLMLVPQVLLLVLVIEVRGNKEGTTLQLRGYEVFDVVMLFKEFEMWLPVCEVWEWLTSKADDSEVGP